MLILPYDPGVCVRQLVLELIFPCRSYEDMLDTYGWLNATIDRQAKDKIFHNKMSRNCEVVCFNENQDCVFAPFPFHLQFIPGMIWPIL